MSEAAFKQATGRPGVNHQPRRGRFVPGRGKEAPPSNLKGGVHGQRNDQEGKADVKLALRLIDEELLARLELKKHG